MRTAAMAINSQRISTLFPDKWSTLGLVSVACCVSYPVVKGLQHTPDLGGNGLNAGSEGWVLASVF